METRSGPATMGNRRLSAAVIGATGATAFSWTAQQLLLDLWEHPWFRVGAVVAVNPEDVGSSLGEAIEKWFPTQSPPAELMEMKLVEPDPAAVERDSDAEFVISCLTPAVSERLDPQFARAGFAVVSESPGLRGWPDVPLLMPEWNEDQLDVIPAQQKNRGWGGFAVSNPVCTIAIISQGMAPIVRDFGVDAALITTMQAMSGAGPMGIPALDMVDNLIPFINTEEEKVESEGAKIFGHVSGDEIVPSPMRIGATCARVPVSHGHVASITLSCSSPVSVEDVARSLSSFQGAGVAYGLPSASKHPVHVSQEPDRPQPRLDGNVENGMSVVVGRIRPEPAVRNGVKFVVAGHNMSLGTVGNTLLCAELLHARELLGAESR